MKTEYKIGDWVECIEKGTPSHTVGKIYKVREVRKDGLVVKDGFGFFRRFRLAKESNILRILKKIEE